MFHVAEDKVVKVGQDIARIDIDVEEHTNTKLGLETLIQEPSTLPAIEQGKNPIAAYSEERQLPKQASQFGDFQEATSVLRNSKNQEAKGPSGVGSEGVILKSERASEEQTQTASITQVQKP
jgi:hypothetical protein